MSTSPKILCDTGVTQELTAGHQLALTFGQPRPGNSTLVMRLIQVGSLKSKENIDMH